MDGKDAAGNTPLMDACGGVRGHRDAARLLLDAGADVNARSRSGRTPLLAAVMHANLPGVMHADLDLIGYLLRCGAEQQAEGHSVELLTQTTIEHAPRLGSVKLSSLPEPAAAHTCARKPGPGRTPSSVL